MATPLKKALFFLVAAMMLRASPALSVPLASGVDPPATTADGPDYSLPSDDAAQPLDGNDAGTDARARIVDNSAPHSEYGMTGGAGIGSGGSSHTPGWLVPAAVVGAGGGTLFALLSHGGKQTSSGGPDASGLDASAGGTTGASLGQGHGGNGNGTGTGNGSGADGPSPVPEPGTLLMMGLGVASFLGRRKVMKA
jgi:hypothetical protein